MRKIFLLTSAVAAFFSLTACSITDPVEGEDTDLLFLSEMEKPLEGAVSIHTIINFPQKNDKELQVNDFYSSQKVTVEKTPWLTSLEIKDIIPVERPVSTRGIYDLKLVLTEKGVRQWNAIVKADTPQKTFAFLVDGDFYTAFDPRRIYQAGSNVVVLEGPFDNILTEKLYRRAPLNYLRLRRELEKKQKPSAKH